MSPQWDLHRVPYSKLQPPTSLVLVCPTLTLSLIYHLHSVPLVQGFYSLLFQSLE